ncbi:MAG: BamA/TamA family outer membrane protein [Armatimonadota bacterium]|nr:BamA/TamA family outer membrane protein [Armatimonadota bacterium]
MTSMESLKCATAAALLMGYPAGSKAAGNPPGATGTSAKLAATSRGDGSIIISGPRQPATTPPTPTPPVVTPPPTPAVPAPTAVPATLPPASGGDSSLAPLFPTTPPVNPGTSIAGAPGSGIVVDVTFRGLQHLSKELLVPKLQTRIGTAYSDTRVEADAQALLDTGYFYSVQPRVEKAANGSIVIFELVENPFISSIDIGGNKVVPEQSTLLSLMLTKPNQVLNTKLLRSDLHKIEDYYAGKGYIYARVLDVKAVPDPARGDNTGPIHITVGEGIVEKIQIAGNKKTLPYVILRSIKTKPGSVFNLAQWQADLKAIARLNIFTDIHYDPQPGTKPGQVVLVVTVVEQRTGTVNFGFGYNTRERGVVFLDLADTNFRGRAESVDAQLELGGYQTRGSYRFSFYEPWLGNSNFSGGANLYKQETDRIVPGTNGNSVSGRYFETRTGGGLTTGHRFSETSQVLADFNRENIASDSIYTNVSTFNGGSVTSSSSNVSPFLLQGGNITKVAGRFIQDTRDLPLNPRSGTFDELVIEPGTGDFHNPGDTASHAFKYLKLSGDLRKYVAFGKVTHKEGVDIQKVLAVRLLYGRISTGVPAFQYFFLGGADTLRGYQEDNFFGENMVLGSAELRIPVALNKLQVVGFADLGDAWGGKYTPNKGLQLYPGVGVGVRVVIPAIGPLRLDYAFGKFGPRPHFSIGQTF